MFAKNIESEESAVTWSCCNYKKMLLPMLIMAFSRKQSGCAMEHPRNSSVTEEKTAQGTGWARPPG